MSFRLGRGWTQRRVRHRTWVSRARDAEALRAIFIEDDLRGAMVPRGVICRGWAVHDLGRARRRIVRLGYLDEAMIVGAHEDGPSKVVLWIERTSVLRFRPIMRERLGRPGARSLVMRARLARRPRLARGTTCRRSDGRRGRRCVRLRIHGPLRRPAASRMKEDERDERDERDDRDDGDERSTVEHALTTVDQSVHFRT